MNLKVIRNWRNAIDERGLPDAKRRQFNQELLDFILDDLMPWHRTAGKDFSLLEVNRYRRIIHVYMDVIALYSTFCRDINRV